MQMKFERAFTTRIPLAVLIIFGLKRWENRSCMPSPSIGTCGMSCSLSSSKSEYDNFLAWAGSQLPASIFSHFPDWESVKDWRGKMVAYMDYDAGSLPGDPMWDEGYSYWWHLSNVRLLDTPYSVRGNVGMWTV